MTAVVMDLSLLTPTDGFFIQGGAANDRVGQSVASAGDINGDGFADMILGTLDFSNSGKAYVIFGKAGGTRTNIDLAALAASDGFIIEGDATGDMAGFSVSSAGDINGDGFADMIVGAPFGNDGGSNAGEAYVIFGKAGATRTNIDLTSLAASDGFIIQGDVANDYAGWSVSSAGDINGDGFADMIVGASDGDNGGPTAGEAYVIFGKAGTTRTNIDLTALAASDGFIIQGDDTGDRAGFSVASAGDINGDGFADMIVSAPFVDVGAFFGFNGKIEAGEVYVIFGKAGTTRANIDLTALAASDGFVIQGDAGFDYAGVSVSSAGDINGDGVDDMIVGASGGDNGGGEAGEAYVIFGKAGATRTNIDLSSFTASDGFIIQGDLAGDRAGSSVASAGDINGDGFADLIVGAPFGDDAGTNAGEIYVIFGKAGATRTNIDLTSLASSDGFIIEGNAADDWAGASVASAGDLNDDGFADLIVGVGRGDNGGTDAGGAYVIYGRADIGVNQAPTAAPVTLAAIAEDSGARTITATELLAGAADLDGHALSITAFTLTSGNGTLVYVGNDVWSYTPAANDDTAAAFAYTVSDGSLSASSTASLDITPMGEAPVITSDGGGVTASVSVPENSTAVTIITATDADEGTTFTYSIVGGTDAALFKINATTGALAFIAAPDFEAPTDVGANNFYNVIVRASDGLLFDTQTIAIEVTDDVDTFTGTALANTLTGTNGADIILGLGGNDTLHGLGGADVMNGGSDADTMSGGAGDDTYYVDHIGDRTNEIANEGTDRVFSSVNFSLAGTFIERLELTGVSPLSATGNSQGNTLIGNSGVNVLNGLGGADVLDGGGAADNMFGGTGDDTYYVDHIGDRTNESVNEGFDTVYSSVNFSLAGTFIERLVLAGANPLSATGNSQANTLIGNDAANVLNGLGGADAMSGGKGDDTYHIDHAGDRIVEKAGEGFDIVFSTVSFNLAGIFVDRLVLTGLGTIAATGNSQAQTLIGNDAANALSGLGGVDVLDGRGGADTLAGGTGRDTFAFSTALGAGNIDTISDFSVADDTIQLTKAIFTGLAGNQLAASAFVIGAGASTIDHRIIYNSASGALLFDSDGSGASAAVQFATLTPGLALTAADFVLI
jgi:hypothetical protein